MCGLKKNTKKGILWTTDHTYYTDHHPFLFVRFEKKVKHTHIATHSFTSFVFPFERERERDFVTMMMREEKRCDR